ncbi:MAG TPA: response regulator, partial [Tepidisphaeraceae bacterium]
EPAAPIMPNLAPPVLATPPQTTADVASNIDPTQAISEAIGDDAANIGPNDRVLLVVENDAYFARLLVDIGHEQEFKVVVAARGAAALQMARKLSPAAISLDINLPDIDGWRVLNRLKDDVSTRHIPVQIISTEEEHERGLRMGAVGVLSKPIKTKDSLDQTFARLGDFLKMPQRKIVLIDTDEMQRSSIIDRIAGPDVEIIPIGSLEKATEALSELTPDMIIYALDLPDKKGFDLIDEIKENPLLHEIPMLVYSRKELSKKDELHIKRLTQSTVLKDVRSPQRLMDETALFLHRRLSALPENLRSEIEKLHQPGMVLAGKKILVVDDDIRNIFAMSSILEPHNVNVISAETGRAAIEILQNTPDVDAVLMDIMMPDMDGYDTMRAIRKLAKFRGLPIIALTAKAMKGDREKCIEAGASDYVSKPVDTEQLLALLAVWLHR